MPATSTPDTGVTPSEAKTRAVTVEAGSKAHIPVGRTSVMVVFHASPAPVFCTLSRNGAAVPTLRFVSELLFCSVSPGSTTVIGGETPD